MEARIISIGTSIIIHQCFNCFINQRLLTTDYCSIGGERN